jgi:hypothetical protein
MSYHNQHQRPEPRSAFEYHRSIRSESLLKDAVHNITANGSTRTKDGGIAHFLAEFLAILFELAGLSTFYWQHGAGLTDC